MLSACQQRIERMNSIAKGRDRASRAASSAASSVKRTVSVPGWMRTLARVGFVAKGVVYLIVGSLAVQGIAGGGQKGALNEIAQQPFGRILLSIVALGLAAYACWRFVSGAIDPHDQSSDDAKGIGKRIGYVCSGVAYAALAISAANIVMRNSGGGGGDGAQHWTGRLLDMQFGQFLVGIVAAGVLLGGAHQLKQAISADFRENFRLGDMSAAERTWATRAGRLGHAARAVVYALIAFFLGQAALSDRAEEAGGLGKALQTLQQQPYGSWVLAVAGLGLVAYGLYCFVVARYCDASR